MNELGSTLFENLLVFFILASIFIIIYCRVKNQKLVDVWREIRGT